MVTSSTTNQKAALMPAASEFKSLENDRFNQLSRQNAVASSHHRPSVKARKITDKLKNANFATKAYLEALLLPGQPTDHGHGPDPEGFAELHRLLLDLLGQLTGRRHDHRIRALVYVFLAAAEYETTRE